MKNSARWIGWSWAGLTTLLLAGCGEDPAPQAPVPAAGTAQPKMSAAQKEANKQLAGMVAAVKLDPAAAAVTVKFDLQARPEVNKPLTVRLAFVSPANLDALSATYAADQGLTVATTQTPAEFSALEAGMPYFHEVSVVPKTNGVQYMSAVVQVKAAEGEPRIQTFFVPIVVGAPPAGS